MSPRWPGHVHGNRTDRLWSNLTTFEITKSAWRTENLLPEVFSFAVDFLMNLAVLSLLECFPRTKSLHSLVDLPEPEVEEGAGSQGGWKCCCLKGMMLGHPRAGGSAGSTPLSWTLLSAFGLFLFIKFVMLQGVFELKHLKKPCEMGSGFT